MAGETTLTIERDASWSRVVRWGTGSGSSFAAYDLSGYTARMQIRARAGSCAPEGELTADDSLLIELTTENGRIEIDEDTEGWFILLSLSADDTASLPPGSADYDLFLYGPASFVKKLLEGLAEIEGSVTH